MSDLPETWAWATIGDIADYIQRGKSPQYTEQSELPVINQKCIRWGRLDLQYVKFVHPEQIPSWDQSRYIAPDDILWNSTGTGTVGRAYLVKYEDCIPPKVVDSHVTIIRCNSELDARYLLNWIKGPIVQERILDICDGTTNQVELSRGAIVAAAIPIAPRAEQQRISNKLGSTLARIDACRDRLDRIPSILKRFRQMVLEAATEGTLTADWRLGREQSWRTVRLEQVASDFSYGSSAKSAKTGRVPVLRMGNIQNGRIDWDGLVYTSNENEIAKYALTKGDVLFNRTNSPELVGKTAVYKGERAAIPAGYLIRVRCLPALHPDYLNYCLGSPKGRAYCWRVKSDGVSQSNINATKLAAFDFQLPPIDEQREIVKRVESLFTLADRIEARQAAARKQVEDLTPTLLAKAFRGELVPQDVHDEPASMLLARIAAAQAATQTMPRTRKTSPRKATRTSKEKSAMTKSRQDDDVKDKPYLAGHLRRLGGNAHAEALFKAADLPVADFYKQLAWEVQQGLVLDGKTKLELPDAAR